MANLRQYIPLASAEEVISQSFTNSNTDPYLISNDTIVMAELAHIKPLLGVKFYAELKEQHNNGTLTTNNAALMQYYLVPALCWMTRFEVILEIQNNSSSAGIVTNIDEFADLEAGSYNETFALASNYAELLTAYKTIVVQPVLLLI